jgi:hypothetical protein
MDQRVGGDLMTNQQRFAEAIDGVNWATTDELVSLLNAAEFWNDEFDQTAISERKKADVRRRIKQLRDEHGNPLYASVSEVDEEGSETRRYKQETLFDVRDYERVVDYHSDRSEYHKHMAVGYAKRCKEKFGVQLKFGFKW